MSFIWWLTLAWPCVVSEAIGALRESGDKDAYLCVIQTESAMPALIAAWDGAEPGAAQDRYSRAMALALLQHVPGPFDPLVVARLNPADRRLLADGVHARRGRRSPSPEHEQVFSMWSWYRPLAAYTDSRLRPDDRANIRLADAPPSLAELLAANQPNTPAPAVAEPVASPSLCGCATGAGGNGGGALALVSLLVFRARQRRSSAMPS